MSDRIVFDGEKMDFFKGFAHSPVLTEDYFDGKPLDFGNEWQLFLGDVVVEDTYRITHEQQTPRLFSDRPLLQPEYPWEGSWFRLEGIIYDKDEKLFKTWYGCRGVHEDPNQPDWEKNIPAGCVAGVLCYAESDDMINWRKPFFDFCPIGSLKESNIVFTGGFSGYEGGRVFLNPDTGDREKKYIMIYSDRMGPRVASSPDGRKWADIPGINPIIPVNYDTYIHTIYDAKRKKFQLYLRPSVFAKHESMPAEPPTPGLNYRRHICISESSDLVHWSTPRIVQHASETTEYDQCDNENTFIVGSHVMARMSRFYVKKVEDAHDQKHLAWWTFGPDPYHMNFLDSDEPIPDCLTHDGSSVACHSMLVGYPINANDKTYLIINAPVKGEGKEKPLGASTLAEFRENGFVARVSDEYGGWLLTREFIMRGREIEVNCEINEGGCITAEILYGAGGNVRGGQFIDGYRLENCAPIAESNIHAKLCFNGSADLSKFENQAVYIRFHVVNAKLYAFRVNK